MNNSTQLTVNDLIAIKTIIDNAAVRGAFRANEMTTVGEIYNKLVSFLDTVMAQAAAQSSNETVANSDSNEEIE